jgi:hypothetical protein
MEVVLRPIDDGFLGQVVFPAFERGVGDAKRGLDFLLTQVGDERIRLTLEQFLEVTIPGGFVTLDEERWTDIVHQLLFHQWRKGPDGWRPGAPQPPHAVQGEAGLHLALMLEQPFYPYFDEAQARAFRRDFQQTPEARSGIASLLCGVWEPFPRFPPAQVFGGPGSYRPAQQLAVASWSWRPASEVKKWSAQLGTKLNRLLDREAQRLKPLELMERQDLLDHWMGLSASPAPVLSVTFSGLGLQAGGWGRELGSLVRVVRQASAKGQGLTALRTGAGAAAAVTD